MLLVLIGTQASLNLFITDEAVYLLGADTFRLTGDFIIDNGIRRFGSLDLAWLHFLPDGPNGQTTQYPPGTSIVGGWLLTLFDVRGFVLLNVAATIGCLFVTRALARLLFGDDRIALAATLLFLFGSFVVEYAVGLWPHMVSVLAVNLSLFLFLKALFSGERIFLLSALSGLVLGTGMVFRIDTILLLPVIGLVTLLFVPQWQGAIRIGLGGLSGLAGPVLLMAAINSHRYGTWNPLSYGPDQSGGAALIGYLSQAVIILVLAAGLIAARALGPRVPGRLWAALIIAFGAGALLLSPQIRDLGQAYALGVLRLIVDATWINDPRSGIVAKPDGTLIFWGLSKKALGQSLPWIGILLALVGLSWADKRRSIVIALVLIGVWTLPFLIRSWFGGGGSNMRYFLPVLPVLSILAAWVIARLMTDPALPAHQRARLLLVGGCLASVVALVWMTQTDNGMATLHQVLSTYILFAVAAAGLLAGFLTSPGLRKAALVLTGVGIGTSTFNGFTDTYMSQLRRESGPAYTDLSAGYDGDVLIYMHLYRSALVTPGQYVAIASGEGGLPDPDLIAAALEAGLQVIVPEMMGDMFIGQQTDYRTGTPVDAFQMVEILPANSETD